MKRLIKTAAIAATTLMFVAPGAMAESIPAGTDARIPGATGTANPSVGRSSATAPMRGGAMGSGTMSGGGNPAHSNGGNGPGGRY